MTFEPFDVVSINQAPAWLGGRFSWFGLKGSKSEEIEAYLVFPAKKCEVVVAIRRVAATN